jgi:PII-like signaling protein
VALPEDGCLLRLFIGESDKMDGRPLYEWIVVQARESGLAGATVVRGMMGFGANSRVIHTVRIERLSTDLPIVVEIVDTCDKVESFLEAIESRISGGMATVEKVRIRLYRSAGSDG